MALQLEQIREALPKPKNKKIIAKAIAHQSRLRFHTESFMEASDVESSVSYFLNWVKCLIPKDKFAIFTSLFRCPVLSIDIVNKVYNELERVFDGRNPAITYQFMDSGLRDDWEWYRQEMLKEPSIWREKGWSAMKTNINSILVVDLPEEQTGDKPEPYFYWLDISHVIDYEVKNGLIQWIAFKTKGKHIAVFDDEFYRVFDDKNGGIGGLVSETTHDLGYCPARFFWTTPLNNRIKDLKKSPISSQLANLDWLLFTGLSKRHLDMYAAYPIYSAYEADCDFANNETGDYCDGGFLRNIKGDYKIYGDGSICRCPVCSEKRLVGVGSFIEVPVPTADSPDLRNPISITTIDRDSLEYNTESQDRQEERIFASSVGMGGESIGTEAMNEKQVGANYESRTSVLNGLKTNFEAAQKFVDDTVCRLRYGDSFISSNINWGTEFYLYTSEDVAEQYKQAKASGASEARLDNLMEQLIDTENRNNPAQKQRMLILKQLEPYRHRSVAELTGTQYVGLVDPDKLRIKLNFSEYVDRFERENINITEFGVALPLDKRIDIITKTFIDYGKDIKQTTTGE